MIKGSCLCGALEWTYSKAPERVTACSCTACRRYGALWAYGDEGTEVHLSGPTIAYVRGDKELGFNFCPTCGCLGYWRSVTPDAPGGRRMAVNVRLAENPAQVMEAPIRHFDGLETWSTLPDDGRCVKDMWF